MAIERSALPTVNLQVETRVRPPHFSQQGREHVEADGHAAHQPHGAAQRLLRVADGRDGVPHILEDATTELQQRLARGRDADAAADAVEHRIAQLLFEQQNLAADGRLRYTQPLAGCGERPGVCDGADDLELPQVHAAGYMRSSHGYKEIDKSCASAAHGRRHFAVTGRSRITAQNSGSNPPPGGVGPAVIAAVSRRGLPGWADPNEYAEGNSCPPVPVKSPCALQLVCYNADTIRNHLSHKGLPVTRAWLLRNVQLICVLGVLAGSGLQTVAAAQTAAPRGPSQTQPRLQLSGSPSAARPAGERITHVVRRGETLWSIARRYGTTVDAVKQSNGLRRSAIQAGRRLTIFTTRHAAAQATVGSSGERVTHVVRRGETLWSIARRYGTTVDAVKQSNGLRRSAIQAGRRFTIFTTRHAAAQATVGSSGERVTHVRQARGDAVVDRQALRNHRRRRARAERAQRERYPSRPAAHSLHHASPLRRGPRWGPER